MLRQYHRRAIRSRINREADLRIETRDAILWEVLPDQRKARVKVQGSSTLIPAYYPENWEETPIWMKPGNAVKIMHTAGNRHRIELVGHGLAVPTPTDSSSPMAPTLENGPNSVISGSQVYAMDTPSMQVWVEPGVYRINNVLYPFEYLKMEADSTVVMGTGVVMGASVAVVDIDAAHSTSFRFDLLSVGESGEVTYTKGTPHATFPQIPSTPAGHAVLCWILLHPGATEITTDMINRVFVEPVASEFRLDQPSQELDWETSSANIQLSVLDQYGNGATMSRWRIKGEILTGTGTIGGGTEQTRTISLGSYQTTFTYTRVSGYDDEIDPPSETSPVYIQFTMLEDNGITTTIPILLKNMGGTIIT